MLMGLEPEGLAPDVRRVPVAPDFTFLPGVRARYEIERVAWLWSEERPSGGPVFRRFKLAFEASTEVVRFQFSADQFAIVYLDGHWIARGPDVSPPWRYGFAEYEVRLSIGHHVLEAFVWWLGNDAPGARMTAGPGFALAGCGEGADRLSTGTAPWEVAVVDGYGVERDAPHGEVLESGSNGLIDAAVVFRQAPAWRQPVVVVPPLAASAWGSRSGPRVMEPSPLPEMPLRAEAPGRVVAVGDWDPRTDPVPAMALDDARVAGAQALISAEGDRAGYTIPAHSRQVILWDLENYHAGFPELVVSGGTGAVIQQIWGESLYDVADVRKKRKGDRRIIAGKYLPEGLGDRFLPDGGANRRFMPYWWRCGRYCLMAITTGDQPLVLHRLGMLGSGHPFAWVGRFSCDQDERLQPILRACRRTLEVGSWDSYQDSPYYEQLMYIGDTRLEVLMTYVLNANDVLPRRALELLDASREVWRGLPASRFPCRGPQFITSFALIWILMVRDFAWWRSDPETVRRLLPGCRTTLDRFHEWTNADGLLQDVHGWPYIDWVSRWSRGIPPAAAAREPCGLHSLVLILALQAAADLERVHGEPELEALWRRRAVALAATVRQKFFDADRACLADDLPHTQWSLHAQVYGVLTGVLSPEEGSAAIDRARRDEAFAPASYVFRFYLFEALRRLGRGGEIVAELGAWQSMLDQGAVTVWEQLEPTRSDCHAWSSHPLFHLPCSVLGVQPAQPGFASVAIAPQPGPLRRIEAAVAHPRGSIEAALEFAGGRCSGRVRLPAGVSGRLHWAGAEQALQPGEQKVALGPA